MIVTRKEAESLGLAFYFTGKQCNLGHTSRRRTTNCACYECELLAGRESAIYKKDWYAANKDRILKKSAERYMAVRDEKLAYSSAYQKKNLDRIIRARKERMNTDAVYAIKERVRCLIKESIRRSGSSKKTKTAEILGMSSAEFRQHIERQFLRGMSWENMSEWHIDHIIPISSAATEKDVLALNHHTNLRPLWAADNLIKSNKMEFII